MKNRTNINYTFLLLAIGIVSTILSNPIFAQTEGNSQNQTGGQGQQQGGQGQQQGGQQEGNQTAGTSGGQQQQGGQGQQGNQTGNPLGDIGEQIGNLFK